MNEKQAPLSVRDLRVTIGGNPILRQVNLTFPRNRITCIIGPSGCGKSTLLKTLNRMHYNVEGLQVSGSVLLGTHDVIRANDQELLELRRNIGLVPQKPCPLPMSIFDNVAYGCRIHGMYRKKELPDVWPGPWPWNPNTSWPTNLPAPSTPFPARPSRTCSSS